MLGRACKGGCRRDTRFQRRVTVGVRHLHWQYFYHKTKTRRVLPKHTLPILMSTCAYDNCPPATWNLTYQYPVGVSNSKALSGHLGFPLAYPDSNVITTLMLDLFFPLLEAKWVTFHDRYSCLLVVTFSW